jgi:hypothetical protein
MFVSMISEQQISLLAVEYVRVASQLEHSLTWLALCSARVTACQNGVSFAGTVDRRKVR